MKKLLVILILLLSATAHSQETITFDNISSFSDLTVSVYNNNLNKAYTKINTDIRGSNIADLTITSQDMSTAVSPLVRDQENIGEYVFTGLTLPSSGAATSGTVTAGTAYVTKDNDSTLHRVVTATSSTINNFTGFTTNQDNWVYLDFAGNFTISAVGIGASQPADPSNSIVLGFITVDSGGDITSATETARQTTPPNLRIYQDYLQGLTISRDITDVDVVNIFRGEVDLGSSGGKRRNTVAIDIDFDVSGEGGLAAADTYTADTYYFLYVYPDGDNATNFKGIAGSTTSGVADVTDERFIGWAYSDASMNISVDSLGGYKAIGSAQPNLAFRSMSQDITTTSNTFVDVTGLETRFYSSGRPVLMTFAGTVGSSGNVDIFLTINVNGTDHGSGHYDIDAGYFDQLSFQAIGKFEEGEILVKPQWSTTGGTALMNGATDAAATISIMEL